MAFNDTEAIEEVKRLYQIVSNRATFVAKAERYYSGEQRLNFASKEWSNFHGERYAGFVDNWCAPVANSFNERLAIEGFRIDDKSEVTPDEQALMDDWARNDMDAQAASGILHTITSKRSFVLVWGDENNEPVSTWERADEAAVSYDPEIPSRAVSAIKTWVDDEYEYANLFDEINVFKFRRKKVWPSDTKPVPVGVTDFFDKDSKANPLQNTDGWDLYKKIPNPMGEVPMVEFKNRPVLGRDPVSDIEGVMAMQDAINLLWAYLFAAADFASMPARVVMGMATPTTPILDSNGRVVGEKPIPMDEIAARRIMWLSGKDVKLGQWDAADLKAFYEVIDIAVAHIAAQTRTPAHYFLLSGGMVNVSADGMKAAEISQVMKAREFTRANVPAVRKIYRLFALARDNKTLADRCRYGKVQWKDPENRSEAQLADALNKWAQIGFPFEFLAERAGLSVEDIGRVLEMKKRERELDPLNMAVHNAMNTNAGIGGAQTPEVRNGDSDTGG